jgi:hypothetical protein
MELQDAEIERLRAEVEGLRAALTEIIRYAKGVHDPHLEELVRDLRSLLERRRKKHEATFLELAMAKRELALDPAPAREGGRQVTDRELLEMAAKAAGIELWHEDVFINGLTQKVSNNGVLRWNPLTDDGDALRLAVKLRHFRIGLGECIGRGAYSHIAMLESGPDPDAATRRAIVRAAAEIGKAMK